MNKDILKTKNQEFIESNLNSDTVSLLLKKHPELDIDIKTLIEQIEAKKKCETKLPTWYNTPKIYYPNKLNIEQTSSEITALYKSKLVTGNTIIDLTGGFGVDCYFFSKHFKKVTHCEINDTLSQIVAHNLKQLGTENIQTEAVDGLKYLNENKNIYDCIYIDPSRRHDSKGKVFLLSDCLPNVPKHIDLLFSKSNSILIKTSPLLDISIGVNELKWVKTIHVVAVNNEVKELLWLLEKGNENPIEIKTINLTKTSESYFNFELETEKTIHPKFSLPLSYLYEPNAAILKSGAFKSVASKLNVFKLHQHSHLYTSQAYIDFPGRCFKIKEILPYNKRALKKRVPKQANITTRNFPETVQQIRKKLNIKDGGKTYLFFTTNLEEERIVIICEKA